MAGVAIAPRAAQARLRIRKDATTALPPIGYIEPGQIFAPLAAVTGEAVGGNAQWFQLGPERFCWSGSSREMAADAVATPAMRVKRRADNDAVDVLDDAGLAAVFGGFRYDEVKGGAVTILPDWPQNNIVELRTPVLADIGHPSVAVHRKALAPFQRVFAKIAAAGLGDRLRTCSGTWVPRHKGWDPSRGLSSHSWGVAIDLNAQWNAYGAVPAALGAIGCVRELVPLFESEGFGWGGYFSGRYVDGMHFELARLDL